MSKTHLYIDGQNFLARIRSILRRRGVIDVDITRYDFWGLLNHVFKNEKVDLATIYFAKLRAEERTKEKSEELIEREAALKLHLEQQGIRYVTGGMVRTRVHGQEVSFEEKGVDVKIAVDMLLDAIDQQVDTVILGSSDSDLQPVVVAIRARKTKVIYLGFQARSNRGLMATTDRYILIDNTDVERFYPKNDLAKQVATA
jgi:uncharacterized LabA/DUF88 family protein